MKSLNVDVSTCQSCSNPPRFLTISLILILFFGAFMALPAFACHNGKDHGKHVCDDDGGGDGGGDDGGEGPVPGTANMASFIGPDVLYEVNPRLCLPLELTAETGRFNCEVSEPVRASTAGMNLQTRKRDIELCNSLRHFSTTTGLGHAEDANPLTPSIYQYGWTDPCTDNACQVVVDLSFSGPDISAVTGGKSDAVDLRISGTLSGSISENPFAGEQLLAMSQVSMQFRKPGSTAIAAVCDWYPQSVDGGSGSVVFVSEALP